MRSNITQRRSRGRATVADRATQRDSGLTGVELIAVLGIVGVLGSAVALMITGMTTQAAGSSCATDAHTLATAAAMYLAVEEANFLPEAGDSADRHEAALVERGYLRRASDDFDLTVTGGVVPTEGSSC